MSLYVGMHRAPMGSANITSYFFLSVGSFQNKAQPQNIIFIIHLKNTCYPETMVIFNRQVPKTNPQMSALLLCSFLS